LNDEAEKQKGFSRYAPLIRYEWLDKINLSQKITYRQSKYIFTKMILKIAINQSNIQSSYKVDILQLTAKRGLMADYPLHAYQCPDADISTTLINAPQFLGRLPLPLLQPQRNPLAPLLPRRAVVHATRRYDRPRERHTQGLRLRNV
jgi:hypothetical protein